MMLFSDAFSRDVSHEILFLKRKRTEFVKTVTTFISYVISFVEKLPILKQDLAIVYKRYRKENCRKICFDS